MKLSIVVPCFNEEDNIFLFYDLVEKTFQEKDFEYEYIFINDGSKDHTFDVLQDLAEQHKDSNISIINFSRNFGKESAMYAGLKESVGMYTILIDADLQQDPKYIVEMMKILDQNEEYDSVAAFQEKRKEGNILRGCKSTFYHMINKISQVEFVDGASDFRLLRRSMVDAIVSLPENNRFSKGLFSWIGFRTYYMPYEVHARENGCSSWSFWELFKYAIEGFVSFTTLPLRIATILGIVFLFFALLYLIIVLFEKFGMGMPIPGYATITCLILLIGGVQLLCFGIMGEYLSRTYLESKHRPIYIQKDKIVNKAHDVNK